MREGALFCLALLATVPTAAFPAHVVSCHDGDTCIAETGQETVRIRLAEIDRPEIDQRYGTADRDSLYAMVCGMGRQRRIARDQLRNDRRVDPGR